MRNDIRFLLNGKEQRVRGIAPDTTLLNWLRLEARLTGSKEGCAEGDCGACTVMVSRRDGRGGIRHGAVNACIVFMPMLDGAAITTIEGLAGPGDALHPAQSAVIKHHGAQCGFCTPGFVMSMATAYAESLAGKNYETDEVLSGNLCRCTGYGPLADAMESLHGVKPPRWLSHRLKRTGEYLQTAARRNGESLAMEHSTQSFYAPQSLDELARIHRKNPRAQIFAGSTDVGLWVTKQHRAIPCFISLRRIPELHKITKTKSAITIGAAVNLQEAWEQLRGDYPGMNEVWRRFGSRQVRETGTVCGNIANASPIGDINPCCLALGGRITLNKAGKRREVRLDDFFIAYGKQKRNIGEFVESVTLPRLDQGEKFFAYKISKRFDQDISAVLVAVWLKMDGDIVADARIACGGMAATPKRAFATEAALLGHDMGEAIGTAITKNMEKDFKPISDMRASAQYRMAVAKGLLQKMQIEYAARTELRLSKITPGTELKNPAQAGARIA